jgi:hypothetical protein
MYATTHAAAAAQSHSESEEKRKGFWAETSSLVGVGNLPREQGDYVLITNRKFNRTVIWGGLFALLGPICRGAVSG